MGRYALIEQCLNGFQLGAMLFMISAGLTLVFGIMNLVNMAQGSLYMLGAYFASTMYQLTGVFLVAIGTMVCLGSRAQIAEV